VLEARAALGETALAEKCLAGVQVALLDDGFLAGNTHPLHWHEQFVAVRRVLRIESVAERLLQVSVSFADFLNAFRAEISAPGLVALKTVAAYRCGLEVDPPDAVVGAARFLVLKERRQKRLTDKPFIDFLIGESLRTGALPLQIHCGLGDPDLDMRLANPLHLRKLIESTRVPLVLLHAAWPFAREAAWLASVYPNVHVDFGLAVPFLSVDGMRSAVRALLEIAPASKIMYSSDASRIPDLFYLGAKWGRKIVADALDEVPENEARALAAMILADNARVLYRL